MFALKVQKSCGRKSVTVKKRLKDIMFHVCTSPDKRTYRYNLGCTPGSTRDTRDPTPGSAHASPDPCARPNQTISNCHFYRTGVRLPDTVRSLGTVRSPKHLRLPLSHLAESRQHGCSSKSSSRKCAQDLSKDKTARFTISVPRTVNPGSRHWRLTRCLRLYL